MYEAGGSNISVKESSVHLKILLMNIEEKFHFGKYQDLRLIDVYRGTLNIDRQLLKDYVGFLLNSKLRFHFENIFGSASFECVDEFEVIEHEIKTLIFHETWSNDDGSESHVELVETTSNIEDDLASYLSIGNQRMGREMGGFYSLSEFSKNYKPRLVVGADPEYLSWCIKNIENFFIPTNDIEKLKTSIFNGIHVIRKEGGLYEYFPNIVIQRFQFPENIKQLNQTKFSKHNLEVDERRRESFDNGPRAYGYDSWEEMSFYEAYKGDSDAWAHDNQ